MSKNSITPSSGSRISASSFDRQSLSWLGAVGLLLIMIGTAIPLLVSFYPALAGELYKYIYAAGAGITLLARLFMRYNGDNIRVRRLMRIEVWAAVFFVAAAVLMWLPMKYGVGRTDWIAFTLAGGVITIYTTIMIPRASGRA